MLDLAIDGFRYEDLYDPDRLAALAQAFYADVEAADADLGGRYSEYRDGASVTPVEESELILELSAPLSAFITRLFSIEDDVAEQRRGIVELGPIWAFKKQFLGKRVRKVKDAELDGFDAGAFDKVVEALVSARLVHDGKAHDFETVFAAAALDMVDSLDGDAALAGSLREAVRGIWTGAAADSSDDAEWLSGLLTDIARWCKVRAADPEASTTTSGWVGFKQPAKIDFHDLVAKQHPSKELPELMYGPDETLRRRDGFKLTDRRYSQKQVAAEVDYCILCHSRDKDSCSKGVVDKQGATVSNPLGIELTACPLDEKISEMHAAFGEGDPIGALALVMIDNPMCPGTGHRICNDCMKGCIYQKFEPVDIPQIETRVLTDVLSLPWGFEIYCLLTRWNPLNRKRPHDLPYNGKDVMVVGLGPAGYTLAHYLAAEGFGVVGIDGLKLEPLADEILTDESGAPQAVRDFEALYEELDERALMGFGGVAEYGITVRWDKNFLKVLRIALERRSRFEAYGGVRFGGTITVEDAWELGFDHVAIATGAGKPTVVSMKNNLIRGVRKASDFLMALQLTGAQKADSMANLQVRLPAVVVGGGLTAIDTTTEVMAYYPVQVEKTLMRYEVLEKEGRAGELRGLCREEEIEILDEFLEHGRAIRAERERAVAADEDPNFVPLVRSWGGVTTAYRKSMHDSPAYRLNHEEIIKALEEGIGYADALSPIEAKRNQYGSLDGLVFERQHQVDGRWTGNGDTVELPARSLFVAAGTSPNVMYEREYPGTFEMDKRDSFFERYRLDESKDGVTADSTEGRGTADLRPGVLTSYSDDGRYVSYFGDNHPNYAGNVVKAMASARDGYPQIVDAFADELAALDPSAARARDTSWKGLIHRLDDGLISRIVRVDRLTPTIVEVFVHAPFAAKRFEPGQFFRLQNYETLSPNYDGTTLASEGMALTGAWVDAEKGLMSTIVLEMGGSSRLCATWQPGARVICMGPTGTPTEIPTGETVILCGGGLGNAVLFSIGKAMRDAGNRVVYFAAYKDSADMYHREDIEAACDVVIWSVDRGDLIVPSRPQDFSIIGNVLDAIEQYATGSLGDQLIDLKDASRLLAIGSDRMMVAVRDAIHGRISEYLDPDIMGIGSINSSMQCMMKAICGQCLQKHIDPETGEETEPVFSCVNQDQRMDEVDFTNLNERLSSNAVLEKLANLWLDRILTVHEIERV